METRTITITQVRVYKLILNDMRDAHVETCTIAAISTEYEKLVEWYKSQIAPEPWRDGRWHKVFAEGTPLEWYNPVYNLELNAYDPFDQGIRDEWVREEVYLDIIGSGHVVVV